MNKYIVKVTSFFATFVEVDADNESDARVAAEALMKSGDKELEHHYEGTLPVEEWVAVEKSKLEELQVQAQSEQVTEQKNSEDNKS